MDKVGFPLRVETQKQKEREVNSFCHCPRHYTTHKVDKLNRTIAIGHSLHSKLNPKVTLFMSQNRPAATFTKTISGSLSF